MPKKKTVHKSSSHSSSTSLSPFKHHLIPSAAGGVVAYLLSGVVLLALGVFASVWVGNMISHHLHKK